ncbi:MAG TPA: protein kinase [Candidatus Paceibacterota bacterium]|nr:protein kinase [Candidatus Paceibacterota bacterium]
MMSVSEPAGHPVACPHCGAPVSAGLLAGLCPHCVARLALAAPAAWTDPPRVRYFGDYELLEEIGRGSMGVVFKARQVSLNRLVAVKMLLHGDFSTEESVRRFHTEAEAAASLQHPNIVAIHEIGVHEGRHYFSMDFIEGQTLSGLADGGPLPARQAARYLQAIAEAVHHAHQHGVLHRDLKPANIIIDTRNQRKLFDWASVTPNGFSGSIALSPDRTRLLCNPQNGAWAPTMDVFICDLDGQNVQVVWEDDDRLDRNAGTADESLVWLSTNRVAWCRHARPGNRVPDMAIVACELGQTNLQALTGWHGFNYPLAASPDGRRLLFVTEDTPGGGNLELWTMAADGTDRRQVADHKFSCDLWMTARWVRRLR